MQFRKLIFMLSVCALLVCGAAAQAGYIDNGDGTVTDNGTGLMWQQATAPDNYTWEHALAYCDNSTLGDYTDWRLPTAKELASLVDTNRYNPSINPTYFSGTGAVYYWSSTTYVSGSGRALGVNFYDGGVYDGDMMVNNYVRAVRGGQSGAFDDLTLWPVPDTGQTTCYNVSGTISCPSPGQPFYGQDANYSINSPAYTKLAAGCTALPDNATTWVMVRAAVTGLVWEEKHAKDSDDNYTDPNDADNTYSWSGDYSGHNFISNLNTANYGGFSDWRMPTVKELQSIVDYGRFDPSINPEYFPNTAVASGYWSFTEYEVDSGNAWYVNFGNGKVNDYDKTGSSYVRAVRGGQSAAFDNLTLFKSGAGTGSVTSSDGKMDCGSDCSETHTSYISCTEVTLTAAAALGSTFAGWRHSGCSGTGSCTVTMNAHKSVTAEFELCSYAIGTNEASYGAEGGSGSVNVIADSVCSWAASSNAGWITITSGATGSGSAAVAYSVAANTGAARTGTLTIAGQTFTVIQGYAQGALQVAITPQAVVDAGAQWRRVGTQAWFHSGQIEGGIEVGQYAIEFKAVDRWNSPANQPVTIDNSSYTSPLYVAAEYAPGCLDKDGDGYGDNCTAGADCDDNDSFYNETCPDCTVKVIPRVLGRFLGENEKTRRLIVTGKNGTEFDETTPVRWETDAITVVSKRVLFKRFMFMKVRIDGAAFGTGDYRAMIGDCSGKLTLVK
jgi:hypothetical protein